MNKRWIIRTPNPQKQVALSNALGIHPIVAQILINRDITDPAEADAFLAADLSHLQDPFLLKDMDRAVARIFQARDQKQTVLIYGDYDVDGVTSSALLRRTLKRLGIQAINYIPHRMEEGYGLNQGVVEFARSQGVHLVITVDCGINAFKEVEGLNVSGVDVVILDHHEPDSEQLPAAYAVIDPKRKDCPYPFKSFAAVGLVAKLAQALLGELPEEELDLVAIGTIADVVPLRGENRIFTQRGLTMIERTSKPGLLALLDIAKIRGKKIKPYYIGFILGPRLNAAGRMDSATLSLDLLLSEDYGQAQSLAAALESHNVSRQKMQNTVVQEALAMIEQGERFKEEQIIVVHKEGWHKGVLGIVASRIMEKYSKPTIVISVEGGLGTGSCRSLEGFHLHEALTSCAGTLENYGGHKRAAGLRLRPENIDVFRENINSFARSYLSETALEPLLEIDCEVPLANINMELAAIVDSLEPHGEGNPSPLFCSRRLVIKSPVAVMGKDTLKFWVTDGARTVSAVGFGMGDFKDKIKMGSRVDLAYGLTIDDWNKEPMVQLKLKDIKVIE